VQNDEQGGDYDTVHGRELAVEEGLKKRGRGQCVQPLFLALRVIFSPPRLRSIRSCSA
jgi:hypothetical protein